MSTHCHSRNEGMHKAVVCSTVSTHTELPGSVIVYCVLSGFLGQEVEHMDLVAIAWELALRRPSSLRRKELNFSNKLNSMFIKSKY